MARHERCRAGGARYAAGALAPLNHLSCDYLAMHRNAGVRPALPPGDTS